VVDTSPPGNKTWAAYLQRVRRGHGWTIQRLADEAGIGRSTIQDWLKNGGSEKIKIETIVDIARAVGDHPVNAFIAAAGLIEEEPQDREIGMILASDLSDEEKQYQIERIEALQEDDRQRRMAQTQEIIRIHGGRVA